MIYYYLIYYYIYKLNDIKIYFIMKNICYQSIRIYLACTFYITSL